MVRPDGAPRFQNSDFLTLAPLVEKLQHWAPLDIEDRAALLALPCSVRRLKAGHYIAWDGDQPQHMCVLIQGFVFCHKVVGDGGRQILSLHLNGDLIGLQHALVGVADHNVQMLTDGEVALVPVEAIRRIAFERPAVSMAMWHATLVDGAMVREWMANNGRRSARARIAHLLCELGLRLEVAGLGSFEQFDLPMSQEWISDAVSLTSVHVNRVLKDLEAEGVLVRSRRSVQILDRLRLISLGDFNPAYLHLDPAQSSTL